VSLASGSKLLHYELLGPLGAGAMGEVYRAKDSKLGREVAIKVLPEHFAANEERLRRFEREAKTLASLNHTNVAQIFGVDQVGDTCFLVLELVPGVTLEERLKQGPLSIDETLDVCRQIASGLEAAHEAGVIHRDLKPANIRLTPDGKVKVLDFGLAKPAREGGGGSSTDSVLSTESGRLLGTPTYMAPEQARGKSIDKRVDIWAFGCVLYECLTGKRAFAGETLTDVLGAVLHTSPDLSRLPQATPPRVRELLARCFEKDPHERLRDAGDARWVLAHGAEKVAGSAPVRMPKRTRAWLAVLWIASLAGAVALAILLAKPAAEEPRALVRSSLRLPQGMGLSDVDGALAVSPDGRRLVLCASRSDEEPRLYVQMLESLVPQPLSGTEGARYPFWSPDSRTIAFFAKGKLKRIPAGGGAATTICEATIEPRGGTWGPDDAIIFAPAPFGPLQRVSASGGSPTPLTQASGRISHRLPHFLPDGKRVLYSLMNTEADGIHLLELASGKSARVSDEKSEGICVSNRTLLFVRGGNLMAQPFDPALGKTSGEAKLVAEGVLFDPLRDTGTYSVSDEGTLVYLSDAGERRLEWFDAAGRSEGQFGTAARIELVSLSPSDDRILALVARDNNVRELQLLDPVRGLGSRFVEQASKRISACWSPDGKSVAYWVSEGETEVTSIRSTSGEGAERRIEGGWPNSWSRDGVWILMGDQRRATSIDVLAVRADGSEKPRAMIASPASEDQAQFSPDGHWFVFVSDQSGRPELYATAFPGPGPLQPITAGGVGETLCWLGDGRVFYLSATGSELWSVSVLPKGETLEIGTPVRAFGGRKLPDGPVAISADGKRVLIAVSCDADANRSLTLVQNWPSMLGGEKR